MKLENKAEWPYQKACKIDISKANAAYIWLVIN